MMQQLNSSYCQSFNRRHRRVGHVLQGRYKSPLVDSDVYFLRVVRYIVRNPVTAGLVREPEDWQWSSYRATAGLIAAPAFLDVERAWAALDASDAGVARERFVTFASTAVDDDVTDNLFLVGSEAFATQCAARLRPYQGVEEFVYRERFAARPQLTTLIAPGLSGTQLDHAARLAFCRHAYTLKEIATLLQRPVATVWSQIQRAGKGLQGQLELTGLEDQKIEI